ncbi:LysR family transcriptional regulator, partial [Vibrio splendidus]
DEIETGSLEVITLEYKPEDLVLYAFYASRKHIAKKVPMFIEHLKHQANLDA